MSVRFHRTPLFLIPLLAGCATLESAYDDFSEFSERAQREVVSSDCPDHSTPQCAIPIALGEKDSDTFTRNNVYYRFEVESPDELVFTVDPIPNTRGVRLEVQDANFNRVYSSAFDAGHPGSADVKIRTPGTYYAVLTPAACCSGASYDYGFLISTASQTPALVAAPAVATDCPQRNTPQCAIRLSVGEDDSDRFGRDPVYYSFEIDNPQALTFTLDPMPTNRGVSLEVQDAGYNPSAHSRLRAGKPRKRGTQLPGSGKILPDPEGRCLLRRRKQ